MTQNPYLWLIPTLPLAGAAINGFLGRRSSKTAVTTIALVFPVLAFALALWIAFGFSSAAAPYGCHLAHWIRSGNFSADFSFYLDQLSLVMLLVVTGVGFLIHVYSVGYMAEDPSYYRFFTYLNLFMFFMLMLILANNYLVMFIGWEESLHSQPNRRLRILDRTIPDHPAFWIAEFHGSLQQGTAARRRDLRRRIAYRDWHSADGRSLRQISADSALRLAS